MPFSVIPFALLIIPVVEIAVFITVGGRIGVAYTVGLILFTAVLGTILLRIQGFRILNRVRNEIDAGRLPGKELGNGAMILVAGILLLTPGFVTDTIGFLLFVPAVRTLIWRFVAARISVVTAETIRRRRHPQEQREEDETIIDLDEEDYSSDPNPRSPWKDSKDDGLLK